jgi:aminopeptidase N
VLGRDTFDRALREYVKRWAFKHPQPADFFRTIEDVSGRDLDWFWRAWFFTTDALDQSVDAVTQKLTSDGKFRVQVVIKNVGQMVMPVVLQLTFADGTNKLYQYPVEIWYKGDQYTTTIITDQAVTAAAVNPDGTFPDIAPQNTVRKASGN